MAELDLASRKFLLQSYRILYKRGTNAVKSFVGDETTTAFASKVGGLPVRWAKTQECLDCIPDDEKLFEFLSCRKRFWIVPLEAPDGTTYGFFLSYYAVDDGGKSFHYFSFSRKLQMFGFYKFGQFLSGLPIVLVEGVKDALFVQQFYPFCLALFSNALNSDQFQIVRSMTDKFVCFFDSDAVDSRAKSNTERAVKEIGDRIVLSGGLCKVCWPSRKDPASFFVMPFDVQRAAFNQVRNALLLFDRRTADFMIGG